MRGITIDAGTDSGSGTATGRLVGVQAHADSPEGERSTRRLPRGPSPSTSPTRSASGTRRSPSTATTTGGGRIAAGSTRCRSIDSDRRR
ncbi:hypothetical protein G6F50_017162 [Rhizopus delemar]|uniref:Uncharacterized protein n=1 Tax=Rhizopus delemar TaxID=936053 RepID=A0A9P7C0Z0_9FUNG|nr:hypothetical protein G6F50_017162 [Rhizopus delemar]